MNLQRLQLMGDFLSLHSVEDFDMSTWVTLPEGFKVGRALDRLPQGSRACPVGWLPAHCANEWCWRVVQGDVYPVLKSSHLWADSPVGLLRGDADTWMSWYVWRQLGEWLEADNIWLLQFLFSPSFYSEILRRSPAAVVARTRKMYDLIAASPQWETGCPDHPCDVGPYMISVGFDCVP